MKRIQWTFLILLGGLVAIYSIMTTTMHSGTDKAVKLMDAGKYAAKDITIKTETGDVHLSQFKGKAVLVDFWGTWCGPCRMSIPGIIKLVKEQKSKGLEVLGVALENDRGEQIPGFVKDMGINYAVGIPYDRMETVKEYGANEIPLMVLVDRKGFIRWAAKGFAEGQEKEMAAAVDMILAE